MSDFSDENCNSSNNEHFQEVLQRSTQATVSRRSLIRGGLGFAALSSVPFLSACGGSSEPVAVTSSTLPKPSLAFSAVGKSLVDNVILPAGYTYTVLHATGDRLASSISAYSNQGTETDDWSQRVGDHHDGMDIYYIDAAGKYSPTDTLAAGGKAVIAMNHESSADAHFFHPSGQTSNGVSGKKFNQFGRATGWDLGTRPELESLKEINHHGVSICEVKKTGANWSYVIDSSLNRRVTGQTLVNITGPAAHLADIKSFMVTKFDPTGSTSRGTLNNCGHGKTPWGTYLTCEENWAAYFNFAAGSAALANPSKARTSNARYGVAVAAPASATSGNQSMGWHTTSASDDRFTRWNIAESGASAAADFRNEANTFGYNVEVDPLSPASRPAKRVAMGRFAHEAAVCGIPVAGRPLAFYMGCDSQNEYIYKFVSAANWDASDVGKGMAAGDKYLTEGKLYVAKFNADGTGDWLELSTANIPSTYTAYAFANQADILVNTRLAADAVGATKMDRPEWGAVNPRNGEIYFTMTNNSSRTVTNTDAANPRAYTDNDAGGRSGNPNGHIVRFKEMNDLSTATKFAWDIFLFGAEDDQSADVNRSGLTASNAFSSPDGLWFSKVTGICWIQTDDGAFTSETNCMLVAAVPGQVGDGAKTTINNNIAGVTGTRETFLGAALGEANLRRFLVAPKGAEVTGLTESADGKTLFINIQHPGESTPALGAGSTFVFESQWPGNAVAPGVAYGQIGRPRSATIVVTRTDGGVIGI